MSGVSFTHFKNHILLQYMYGACELLDCCREADYMEQHPTWPDC